MALHFERSEFDARQKKAVEAIQAAELDGLLMFRQESMFYLTGYDTFGFCFFQCLYLGADGRLALLTRAPDLRQAQHTSIIRDIRVWVDREGATPADDLKAMLGEFGCAGRRLGVEWDAYGLTAANGRMLSATLDGFVTLEDAAGLVSRLRLVKSPSEIAYVREAARLCDDSLDEAIKASGPGADEGEILAAMQGAVFRGGGDYPGNEFIIGSGRDALLCRYYSGRRKLDARDQLTLEFAGVYRRYHACMMRTLIIGEPRPEHVSMHRAADEALAATEAALVPGRPVGEAFDAHARVLDAAGLGPHRLNACGYSLGATFSPMWMDWPMLYHGSSVEVAPGMVFFLHMVIVNSDTETAMTLGHTILVGNAGAERLSRHGTGLILC